MAVKKSTKKAAKKTYPRKKNPPKPRRITLDDLTAVVAETEARIAKSREETDAAIGSLVKQSRKTDAAIESLVEQSKKTDAAIESLVEQGKKTDAAVEKMASEIRELSRNVGHVGKDLGELMEFIVIPKIRLAMNATGQHIFNTMQTGKKLKKTDELGQKKTLTEVDVLLYGDTEVMAVETKSHLLTRDVKDHIDRLEVLRQNEDLIDIADKKLVGAVVGAIVDEGAKDFALEKGLYVITIREEEGKLNIEKPETCRTW